MVMTDCTSSETLACAVVPSAMAWTSSMTVPGGVESTVDRVSVEVPAELPSSVTLAGVEGPP